MNAVGEMKRCFVGWQYACRKTLADNRPRIRGRFARNDETGEIPKAAHLNRHEDEDDLWVIIFLVPKITILASWFFSITTFYCLYYNEFIIPTIFYVVKTWSKCRYLDKFILIKIKEREQLKKKRKKSIKVTNLFWVAINHFFK